jgi:hypothetical protein
VSSLSWSAPAKAASAAPARAASKGTVVLAVVLALTTLVAAILTNGNLAATLGPTAAFLVLYAIVKLPIRYTWFAYIWLVLSLDTPPEPFAAGKYKSPFYTVALLLTGQLKAVLGVSALVMTGLDIFLLSSFVLTSVRRAQRSSLDRDAYIRLPRPILFASWAALLGILWATVIGLATGGAFRFAQWQIERNVYLPLVLLVVQAVFPGPESFKPFTRVLIGAALVRSVAAILLRQQFPEEEYTSSHSDSMLFGTVTVLLVLRLVDRPTKRDVRFGIPALIVIVWGMIANDRRLVWVELALAAVFILVMTPRTRRKISLARGLLSLVPVAVVYIAVGWSHPTGVFKPVGTVRSIVDSKSDGSTLWRDLENFNLVTTFAHHPLGLGFGHPYELAVWMPDVTRTYELEPYLPHNSIVGLWAYTGYIGFTLLWLLPTVALYFAARAYRFSTEREDRIMALTCFAGFFMYLLQCYGDMGLGSMVSVVVFSPLIVMVGKLAVKVGAWPGALPAAATAAIVREPNGA